MSKRSPEQVKEEERLFFLGKRRCRRCIETKSLDDFGSNRATESGYNYYCKPCYTEYGFGWRKLNADKKKTDGAEWYAANRDRVSAAGKKHRKANWVYVKLKNTRAWCVSKNVPYDLDSHLEKLEARYAKGVCEMTGLRFAEPGGRRAWNTPSIDRIDPSKGYTYDNVRFVLWIMNAAMSEWGEHTLAEVMRHWLDNRYL